MFRFNTKKKLLTVEVVGHWHRLPRGMMGAPFMEVFKASLDRGWKVSLPMTGGLEIFKFLSNTTFSCHSLSPWFFN